MKKAQCLFNAPPIIILCFILWGCAGPKLPPPSALHIDRLDTRPLKGKIIVLDPGHGGPEKGAIGPHGLKESEANLGVALYLWGLLQQAGAQPILTRSADNSVYTDRPFALDKDLDARSAISNRNNADLFISIHHNADANNPRRNDVQIYYKMSDSGPSRDIAKSVLQALMERLQVAEGNIYSGDDLLSHAVTHAVPSALEGLTSVFGMGTGVTPPLSPPKTEKSMTIHICSFDQKLLDYGQAARSISTSKLNPLPGLHPWPINLVVYKGSLAPVSPPERDI